jgi:uncharacterized protein
VVAALLAAGVPLAPVMVFLITSPLISPSAFAITWGGLGAAIATTKLAAALSIGLGVGVVTHYMVRNGFLADQVQPRVFRSADKPKPETTAKHHPAACGTANSGACAAAASPRVAVWMPLWSFTLSFWKMGVFIGRYVLIGLVAQTALVRYLPQAWIEAVLGSDNQFSVLLSAIIGIPAYMNSMAAIPLLQGLLEKGMDPGAAVAFIIAGPVASIPSIAGVVALVRGRALGVYILSGFLGAVAFGYLFSLLGRW